MQGNEKLWFFPPLHIIYLYGLLFFHSLFAFQDVTQKILEAVGNIAASSLEQTSWLSRNLEVKAQSQISLEEPNVENNLQGK